MTYAAPIADMRFVLQEISGIGEVAALPGYEAADRVLADAVLDEAAKFAEKELAPLNQMGDRIGSILENGVVRTPPGLSRGLSHYVEGGWNGLAAAGDRRSGLAAGAGGAANRDVERGLHGVGVVSAAESRRGRDAERARFAEAKIAAISASSCRANGPAR